MNKPDEKRIELFMKNLGLTYEEAVNLLNDDKQVDRMTSAKQWNDDLTDEQKKVVKQSKNVSKGSTGKQSNPKERKVDEDKKLLIAEIANFLQTLGAEVEIENDQKIIRLVFNERKFKVDLSATRK